MSNRAAATIMFAVLLLWSLPLISEDLSIDDIPEIPGSSLKHSRFYGNDKLVAEYWKPLPAGVTFREASDRGRDEAQRCVELMQENGWTLRSENRNRRGGEFFFRKEILKEAKAIIVPLSKSREGKKKDFILFKFELGRLIPSENVLGYDYLDAPRYPGSTRIRWMDILGEYSAKYLTTSSVDEVENYYLEKLQEFGWEPSTGVGNINYKKIEKNGKEQFTEDTGIKIPPTLSIHLSENEGIVGIGIGRSAKPGKSKGTAFEITPVREIADPGEEPLTFIKYETDIPIYPGLDKKSVEQLPITLQGEEVTRIELETRQAEQIEAIRMAEFYLEEMEKNGWNLIDEEWHGLGRSAVFKKGAVEVKLNIKAVGRYPIPEKAAKIDIPVRIDVILPIPTRDIAGKDIEGIPRFPGSIRFFYLEAALDHTVKYKAAASQKEVEWFYIEELPEQGWSFSGYDSTGLLFVRDEKAKDKPEKGKLIPTTLKVKVDDMWDGTVKIGLTRTRGY